MDILFVAVGTLVAGTGVVCCAKLLSCRHRERSRAAYRRGDMLDRRRPLMMSWERYLCQERAEVIDLAARR